MSQQSKSTEKLDTYMGSHLHIGFEHEISDVVHPWQYYFRVSDMKNFEAPGHATTHRQHSNI